jgi:hypothetical protein
MAFWKSPRWIDSLAPLSFSEAGCTGLPVISGVAQLSCEHWLLGTPLH